MPLGTGGSQLEEKSRIKLPARASFPSYLHPIELHQTFIQKADYTNYQTWPHQCPCCMHQERTCFMWPHTCSPCREVCCLGRRSMFSYSKSLGIGRRHLAEVIFAPEHQNLHALRILYARGCLFLSACLVELMWTSHRLCKLPLLHFLCLIWSLIQIHKCHCGSCVLFLRVGFIANHNRDR